MKILLTTSIFLTISSGVFAQTHEHNGTFVINEETINCKESTLLLSLQGSKFESDLYHWNLKMDAESKTQCYKLAVYLLENYKGENDLPYTRDLTIFEQVESRDVRYYCGERCHPMAGCFPRYCNRQKNVTVRTTDEKLILEFEELNFSSQKSKSEDISGE